LAGVNIQRGTLTAHMISLQPVYSPALHLGFFLKAQRCSTEHRCSAFALIKNSGAGRPLSTPKPSSNHADKATARVVIRAFAW
jgi:hypothetical protein